MIIKTETAHVLVIDWHDLLVHSLQDLVADGHRKCRDDYGKYPDWIEIDLESLQGSQLFGNYIKLKKPNGI